MFQKCARILKCLFPHRLFVFTKIPALEACSPPLPPSRQPLSPGPSAGPPAPFTGSAELLPFISRPTPSLNSLPGYLPPSLPSYLESFLLLILHPIPLSPLLLLRLLHRQLALIRLPCKVLNVSDGQRGKQETRQGGLLTSREEGCHELIQDDISMDDLKFENCNLMRAPKKSPPRLKGGVT